jgi:hypothetical protein
MLKGLLKAIKMLFERHSKAFQRPLKSLFGSI